MITIFWIEDGEITVIARPDIKTALWISLARYGYRLESETPEWAKRPVRVTTSEWRRWLISLELEAHPWMDTKPVRHFFAQLDDDQAFAFRLRFL